MKTIRLAQEVAQAVEEAGQAYHRLVILVGPALSGKTAALRELQATRKWPLVNTSLAISEKLLELTSRQRALRVSRVLDDVLQKEHCETLMLDNIELLFHPSLKQDPLRLLQGLSRNRTLVATWRGNPAGRRLTYAEPDHPEFKLYDNPQALIVSALETKQASCGSLSTQEQTS